MKIEKIAKDIAKFITRPLSFYDLETTGILLDKDCIIQFAAIKIYPNGKTDTLEFTCKPNKPIDQSAAEVHGITNEMVADKPLFKHFAPEVVKFFEGSDVAGFNINKFDMIILDRQLEELGYYNTFKDTFIFDSYLLYIKDCSRKLADAVRYYTGEEIVDAHDALGDVKSTLAIAAKQLEKHNKSVTELATELTKSPSERICVGGTRYIRMDDGEPILNFSKYKDTPLKKVDPGFLKWMIKGDFPQAIKDYVQKFVK